MIATGLHTKRKSEEFDWRRVAYSFLSREGFKVFKNRAEGMSADYEHQLAAVDGRAFRYFARFKPQWLLPGVKHREEGYHREARLAVHRRYELQMAQSFVALSCSEHKE